MVCPLLLTVIVTAVSARKFLDKAGSYEKSLHGFSNIYIITFFEHKKKRAADFSTTLSDLYKAVMYCRYIISQIRSANRTFSIR